jgi:hypothetical protein
MGEGVLRGLSHTLAKNLLPRELNLLDPAKDLLCAREMETAQAYTEEACCASAANLTMRRALPARWGSGRQGDCRDDGITL